MTHARIAPSTRVARGLRLELARIWLRQNWIVCTLYLVATVGVIVLGRDERDRALVVLGFTVFGSALLGFKVMNRFVAADRSTGLFMLWQQKPGLLINVYRTRLATSALLLFAFLALCAPIVWLGALSLGVNNEVALRFSCSIFGWAAIPLFITFAISCWGIQDDAIYAVALLVVLAFAAQPFTLDDAGWKLIVRSALSPLEALSAIMNPRSVPALTWRSATAILVGHCAAWTAIGFAGLRAAAAK